MYGDQPRTPRCSSRILDPMRISTIPPASSAQDLPFSPTTPPALTPTADSTRYEKPIELRDEGETLLSAVAVNKKGMVSEPLVLVYKLDFQEDS